MLAFVIDASATLPWCFGSEATQATNNLLARLATNEEAVVPAHWYFEVSNALLVAVRRARITPQDAKAFLNDLASLPIRIDAATQNHLQNEVFSLAEQFNLTIYDAAYLELARRQALPLATLDEDLKKAAHLAGVIPIELTG